MKRFVEMLGIRGLLSRKQNNNNVFSDYEIWCNSYPNNTFSIAILNLDGNSHELPDKSLDGIKNANVVELSSVERFNEYIKRSASKYILLVSSDCIIDRSIINVYSSILSDNPDVDIIYSDEDMYYKTEGVKKNPFFKPCFSPDTLMSFPYIGKVFLFRTELVSEVGAFDVSLGKEAYYDFILRCFEANKHFYHCSQVLFSQIKETDDDEYVDFNDNIRICQENSIIRRKMFATLAMDQRGGNYIVDYKWDDKPLVSIIIPSKDNYSVIKRCIDSVLKLTFYNNYEIVVVDNGSSNVNKKKYEEYSKRNDIKYVYDEKDFNFSYMCNVGAENSRGEYLLFLNDDTEIIDTMWLTKMLGQAMLPYSGAVGAKLLYGDRSTIQHCGVINNLGPTHAFWGFPDSECYYFGRNRYSYNYLAVTAACLCVSRKKFEEISGFNEELSICYNDVDLCYKLVEKGYYNTVRNDVILIHFESISRGSDHQNEETELRLLKERELLQTLHPQFVHYDPFYSSNLTGEKVDFDLGELISLNYTVVDSSKINEVNSFSSIDSLFVERYVKTIGWIISKLDLREENCTISLVLRSDNEIISIPANRQIRKDVKENCNLRVADVGFACVFPREFIEAETKYTVGIMVTNASGTYSEVTWSDKTVLF